MTAQPQNSTSENPAEGDETIDLSVDAFRAELDVFSGPMELLLYLTKREEVDILEIPIAHITDEYLRALRAMRMFDVNVAAEFMVMAATLMDIKSRSLLPDTDVDENQDDEDPRDDLIHRLLEYKQFKKASGLLEQMARRRSRQFGRSLPDMEVDLEPITVEDLLEDVSVWDLLSAYGKVMREIENTSPHQIVYDEVPIEDYMDEVLDGAKTNGGQVRFLSFLGDDPPRSRIAGLFLALLELTRQRRVELDQESENRTDILIELCENPHDPKEHSMD
ncbi:MAG: segregation and condensation protein A [Planctomycetota bacterium]